MVDIYELMIIETRESFLQLENAVASLNSNAFGMMTANSLLFSVFMYIEPHPSNIIRLLPHSLVFMSFVLLLICVWPRVFLRQSAKDLVSEFGTMNPNEAQAKISANYIELERKSKEKYDIKFKFYYSGLILTALAILAELLLIGYSTLGSLGCRLS